jgi:hypothetical protein
MPEQVKIQKTIYGLSSFNNTINTEFSQLVNNSQPSPIKPDTTVSEFFDQYSVLFYQIPPSGSDETHLGLATRSLEHLGLSLDDLQTEIDYLRKENIELKNQIVNMSNIDPGTLDLL